MFELAALEMGTKSVRLRLNYATDLRYGVLVDIANKVLSGQEIPLEQGYFNTIWQAEANRIILRSFDYADAPSTVLNISGPETLSVRQTAEAFSNTFGRKAIFSGTESKTALLNNANLSRKLYGTGNNVGADTLIEWTASWLKSGGRLINKPTHFEAKGGKF